MEKRIIAIKYERETVLGVGSIKPKYKPTISRLEEGMKPT